MENVGFLDHRTLHKGPIDLKDPAVEAMAGMIRFSSHTIRAFKLPELEDRCEDYGQLAKYLGNEPHHPHRFVLDDHHAFETGKPTPVCGNTASMLEDTRFSECFEIIGNRDHHFGLFDCSGDVPSNSTELSSGACC